MEILRAAHEGHLFRRHRHPPARHRGIARLAVVQDARIAKAQKGIGIDLILGHALLRQILGPERGQKIGLIVDGLRRPVETADQLVPMRLRSLDPHQKQVIGQGPHHRIPCVAGIHHLADRSATVANEIRIAIDVARPFDEPRRIQQGRDLGLAVLRLPLAILRKGHAAPRGIAGLAQIGGQGGEVVEGDVRRDIDAVGHQQFPQKRHLHRLALEIVGDVFAHVARADPVIDRVVEPPAALLRRCIPQHVGQMRLAKARHAEQQHPLFRRSPILRTACIDHGPPPRDLVPVPA